MFRSFTSSSTFSLFFSSSVNLFSHWRETEIRFSLIQYSGWLGDHLDEPCCRPTGMQSSLRGSGGEANPSGSLFQPQTKTSVHSSCLDVEQEESCGPVAGPKRPCLGGLHWAKRSLWIVRMLHPWSWIAVTLSSGVHQRAVGDHPRGQRSFCLLAVVAQRPRRAQLAMLLWLA